MSPMHVTLKAGVNRHLLAQNTQEKKQPRSQGLSSYRLIERARRDPGNEVGKEVENDVQLVSSPLRAIGQ